MPTELWAERARLPAGFLEQIIDYRAYAATKAAYDAEHAAKTKTVVRSEMWQLVQEIEFEIAGEEIAARG